MTMEAPEARVGLAYPQYSLFGSIICSRETFQANRVSNKPHTEFMEVSSICFMGLAGRYFPHVASLPRRNTSVPVGVCS